MDNRELLLQQSKDLISKLNSELEQVTKELKEKNNQLQTYQKITDCRDWYQFGEAAKILNMEIPKRKDKKKFGRNTLMDFAKQHNILRNNKEPYQIYIDNGCSKYFLKEREKSDAVDIVPLLSIKGIELMKGLIDDANNE